MELKYYLVIALIAITTFSLWFAYDKTKENRMINTHIGNLVERFETKEIKKLIKQRDELAFADAHYWESLDNHRIGFFKYQGKKTYYIGNSEKVFEWDISHDRLVKEFKLIW